MCEFFLPVLSHYQNGNPWVASLGRFRYRVVPELTDAEAGTGTLQVEGWEGPWEYELSTVEVTTSFPLEEKGLEDLREWIVTQGEVFNARPARSLEENIARRKTPSETGEKG